MLIKAIGGDITFPQLLWQIFSSMQDPFAIASFILLLVFAIVFGTFPVAAVLLGLAKH